MLFKGVGGLITWVLAFMVVISQRILLFLTQDNVIVELHKLLHKGWKSFAKILYGLTSYLQWLPLGNLS